MMIAQDAPPPADVAVVGFGWAGSIIAAELARQGHRVVVFERGPAFDSHSCGHVHEPGNERWNRSRVQKIARETFTLRYDRATDAVPLRRLDAFLAGEGVGGAGVLWGGLCPRYSPASFAPTATYAAQLAAGRPELKDTLITDWPVSFEDIEPFYSRFEQVAGVAGDGKGNPFAGKRSADYAVGYIEDGRPEVFRDAALEAGLHPYRIPTAEITVPYTNPYGVTREPCEAFGTTIATPLNTTVPAALATGRVTLLTGCSVRRIRHDKGRTTGLIYTDAEGRYHDYAVGRVVLSGWTYANTRLLLLSGIGRPYDPETGEGVVGRNYGNHISAEASAYWERRPGRNVPFDSGWAMSDFEPWLSTQADGPVGGAQIASMPPGNLGFRSRFSLPAGTPRWGTAFKRALAAYADSYLKVTILGEVIPMRGRYMDLDPTYRDAWGDPLLRITFNWSPNEHQIVNVAGSKLEDVLARTGADMLDVTKTLGRYYDTTSYQNSHASGGTIMGTDPATSVVDRDLQCWDAQGLWIVGASTFPTNPAPNPTPTVCALAFRLADRLNKVIAGTATVSA